MSSPPVVSLIIACRNAAARLPLALASIWEQRDAAPEIIVVDGASTDGSREWLEARRAKLSVLISEPDAGVYDAMNKGVAAAGGEWLFFLGSDDRLAHPGVLAESLSRLRQTDAGVAGGEAAFEDGRIYRMGPRVRPLARNFVHHQAAFYRRRLFEENGGFDPALGVMGDYDFNLRLWTRGVRFDSIPLRISICGSHGLSDRGAWRGYREEISVRHRHFPGWRCLGWDALSLARYGRKKIVRSFAQL